MTVDTATGEIIESLTAMETSALTHAEAVIERGIKTFVEVGQALFRIRDERLYRATHQTFEGYCVERWGFTDSRARQLIGAAATVTNVTALGAPAPSTESQARELSVLAPGAAPGVMTKAHEATDGKVTAAAIKQAAKATLAQQAEQAVDEFPALAFHVSKGDLQRAVALAANLREFDPAERVRRLEILDKSIAAEKRRDAGLPPLLPAAAAEPERAPADRHDDAHEETDVDEPEFVDDNSLDLDAITRSTRLLTDLEFTAEELAGDIDYDDLPDIEQAAAFLTDLIAAVRSFR